MVGSVIDQRDGRPLILVMAEGVEPMGNPRGRDAEGHRQSHEFCLRP